VRDETGQTTAKFVELVQSLLEKVHKIPIENMTGFERLLVEMSFGTLTDMVSVGALEFSLTHSILLRKFPDLMRELEKHNYALGYLDFLAMVYHELEDYDLEKRYYSFAVPPNQMDEEQREVYEACHKVNQVVFGPLLTSASVAALSPNATYMLDQGLCAKVARDYYKENKANLEEGNHGEAIQQRLKIAKGKLFAELLQIWSETDDSTELLSELIKSDVKGKAPIKFVRRVDFKNDNVTQLLQVKDA
jgi:hypothetical protein